MLEPTLTYLGDRVESLQHRVMGPDTAGGYVRVAESYYDQLADVTRVRFEPISTEVANAAGQLDEHGQAIYIPVELDD